MYSMCNRYRYRYRPIYFGIYPWVDLGATVRNTKRANPLKSGDAKFPDLSFSDRSAGLLEVQYLPIIYFLNANAEIKPIL